MRRKKDALRSVVLLMAAVLLLAVAGGYGFSGTRVLRTREANWGTGETQIVTGADTPMPGIRVVLSANPRAVLLGTVRGQWWTGWQEEGSLALDCTGEGSIHTGWWRVEGESLNSVKNMEDGNWAMRMDAWGERAYLFGRVDDPAVERLRFQWKGPEGEESLAETGRQEWITQSGRTYFLVELEDCLTAPAEFEAVGLDREDREIAWGELEETGGQAVYYPRLRDQVRRILFSMRIWISQGADRTPTGGEQT